MRKILKKIGALLLTAVIIAGVVLKVVDLHTDNIQFRDRWYYIQPKESYVYLRWDVLYRNQEIGSRVNNTPIEYGANQAYYIEYAANGIYRIKYDENRYVSVAQDDTFLDIQEWSEDDRQCWEIIRYENSQYVYFKSVYNGKYIRQEFNSYNLMMDDLVDSERDYFLMALVP